ncbi:hypothetical protein B0H11DRAFT_1940062 [Mycena galericulata]|nr:hypothetical protein B0H11DRAFT_1940062 [Mycena galericulata]
MSRQWQQFPVLYYPAPGVYSCPRSVYSGAVFLHLALSDVSVNMSVKDADINAAGRGPREKGGQRPKSPMIKPGRTTEGWDQTSKDSKDKATLTIDRVTNWAHNAPLAIWIRCFCGQQTEAEVEKHYSQGWSAVK